MAGELVWSKGRKELDEASDKLGENVVFRPTNASFRPDGGYYLGDGYGSPLPIGPRPEFLVRRLPLDPHELHDTPVDVPVLNV